VQRADVKRTISIIHSKTGRRIVGWRNHAYAYDKNTVRILSDLNIKIWSDEKLLTPFPYKVTSDLLSLPINVMPDHEHMIHCFRTKEINKHSDCFGNRSYKADIWLEIVKTQIINIISQEGIATILAHPICMYHVDGFVTFRKLCEFLSDFRSINISELLQDC
jgi:hypothetical protein